MKLREIFQYEFSYQLRHVSAYIFFIVLLLISYLIMLANYVPDAIQLEFYVNAPFIIASVTVITSMFWLLISPAIAGEAAARDIHTRMYSLIYTSPVKKVNYLGGKFLAALVINSLIMLAIPAGIILASHASGVEENIVGPFRISSYLTSYFFIAFPNIFLATAAQFMCSVITRRPVGSYIAGAAIFLGTYVIAFAFGNLKWSTLLDPVGYNLFINMVPLAWTPNELNNSNITLEGLFLANRLLWICIGMGLLVLTYFRFQFSYPGSGRKETERNKRANVALQAPLNNINRVIHSVISPEVIRSFDYKTKFIQVMAIAGSSFLTILKRKGGFIMLIVIALFATLVASVNLDHFDVPILAETWQVLSLLTAPLGSVKIPWIFIVILISFYAGELIWSEREAGISDIYDTTPTSDWVLLSGKFLTLVAYLFTWTVILIVVGISVQLMAGNFNINLSLYLKILFGLQLIDYLLFAFIAFIIHIIVNQKYVGYLVVLFTYGLIAFAPKLGIYNNLLIFGSGSGWTYTAMQDFSPLGLWILYKFYWIGWTILFAVIARLLWIRGRDFLFNKRSKIAKGRISHSVIGTFIIALVLIITCGGFIFYNTQVVNTYYTAIDVQDNKAEYEKRFTHYDNIPQPSLIKTKLNVEIYPENRAVEISGTYHLVNNNSIPVDSIHINEGVDISQLDFDHSADLVFQDKEYGYRIYKLHKPVQPGDSIKMDFQLNYRNDDLSGKNASKYVVDNGTFFRNYNLLPSIGYQSLLELKDKSDRESYNLPPKPEFASLDDRDARNDLSIWDQKVMVEAVVSTDAGQRAIAPGTLQESWSEGDRVYFKYATNAPIRNEYAFFSADYHVKETQWKNVDIEIFHHPEHNKNLDRIVSGIEESLDYFSEEFGPYPYDQIRFIEKPGTASGLHASPINIEYYEGFSYMNPEADERELDFVFAIVAHEVAHQWWGNQLRYARVEGGGILSESLAWYSAMKVVEKKYGQKSLNELLDLLKKEYETPQSRADIPLIQGNDWFHLYRKGPLALYTISKYIGEEQTNEALHELFKKHGKGQPPFATSLDLYNEIKAATPDSLQYLIHDLFMENTFWDLEMEEAVAEMTSAGDWKVTMQVKANKEVVDEMGEITELNVDDWIEIGVYGISEEAGSMGEPLYLRKHKLKSGQQTIIITVPTEPGHAGIDPNQLLDRKAEDNFRVLSNKVATEGFSFN